MSRIVHFEIPVEDPERSMAFYSSAFGWQFQKFGDENYWLVVTGPDDKPGINGGLMKKNPGQPPTNVVGVDNMDEAVERVKAAGGTIVVEKFEIPTVGWVAYFTDPDGIVTGLHQSA
jgi:predicted enzyme related to lactoylglutathione lyase